MVGTETVKVLVIAASVASVPVAGQALTVVLDDFATAQRVTALPDVDPSGSEIAATESLGGFRDLAVQTTGPMGVAVTTLEVMGGLIGYSNNFNATGIGILTYDGNDADPFVVDTVGLGGINFLIGADPFLVFGVASFESDLEVTVTAWDMLGEQTEYFEVLPPIGDFTPILPLADFSNSSFDWSQVGAFQVKVESRNPNYDGALSALTLNTTEIPLPASVLLLSGGLGIFSLVRKRRRR